MFFATVMVKFSFGNLVLRIEPKSRLKVTSEFYGLTFS